MCLFHVLYLNMMPFFMPRQLQKWIVPFLLLPDFGRITRPLTPHFSALDTQKLHLCTFVLMLETPFSHTPKPNLGYPILPFGVYCRHICAQCTALIFGLPSSFSLQKFVCFLSFRFIMFLRDSFGWIKYIS